MYDIIKISYLQLQAIKTGTYKGVIKTIDNRAMAVGN